MFGKSKPSGPAPDEVETIIGKNSHFTGTVKGDGAVRIEGRVEGEVEYRGDVILGETAMVVGDIKARHITVAGTVKGNLHASGKVELVSGSNLSGDLVASTLVIADGATFEGRSSMSKDDVKAAPVTKVAAEG